MNAYEAERDRVLTVALKRVQELLGGEPTWAEQYADNGGYDYEGYDEQGYCEEGYDRSGYDRDGYDIRGFDRDGIDDEGFSCREYGEPDGDGEDD